VVNINPQEIHFLYSEITLRFGSSPSNGRTNTTWFNAHRPTMLRPTRRRAEPKVNHLTSHKPTPNQQNSLRTAVAHSVSSQFTQRARG